MPNWRDVDDDIPYDGHTRKGPYNHADYVTQEGPDFTGLLALIFVVLLVVLVYMLLVPDDLPTFLWNCFRDGNSIDFCRRAWSVR